MVGVIQLAPGLLFRDAALLALARLEEHPSFQLPTWSEAESAAVRGEVARQLSRQADAAAILGPAAERLVRGIALVPFLEPGSGFGPAWAGHPFASGAMGVVHRMREPDLTRELAALMSPGAGYKGQRRAVGFLRLLISFVDASAVTQTLTEQTRPTVTAEHPVVAPRPRARADTTGRAAASRIDLVFEWPVGSGGQRAVVVVEAKLGATVSDGQLSSYRKEAMRRAKGGPVVLILLTARPDAAERRHRAWRPVRWFSLLRRWEVQIAQAGDADPEFTRVRAHLWRHVLDHATKAAR